ncbi:MAG TPA: hypothetical protein VNW47_03915 [Terriglobales bacterium]|nr:hypothetical protein [Terriglobales bacterium]
MQSRNSAIFAAVLLGLQILASGQNPPAPSNGQDTGTGANTGTSTDETHSTPVPALTGVIGIDSQVPEEDSNSTLPRIPSLLGGPRLSVALGSETERSNYIRGGLNVGATYDDNTFLTTQDEVGNTTYSVFPNISLEQVRSRVTWKLGYAAGLTVNQRLSSRNQGSHDLDFDSQFRLSPHVNVRVAEEFTLTSGFFDSGIGGGVGVGNGGPNASLVTPLSRQRASSTVVEANYHFALNDLAGVSGSFYDLHFSDVAQGATLTNSRTASASAFWLHGFGRDWLGIDYRFQRLTFGGSTENSDGETRVHSILAVNTITLPNHFTVTGFVGPEYSENQGLVPGSTTPSNFNEWSFSGGVEAGWQRDHTSLAVGYSRRINDGSGVLGVVRLQGLHGEIRQQLRPGWAISAGGSYGNNKSLTIPVAGTAQEINSASLDAGLERNLGKSLGLRVGYGHDFQEQLGAADSTPMGFAHRNRFSVTLGYQWSRPLGR